MLRTISASDLRTRIKWVLNEVGYGRGVQYVVQKFGEPTAAIVSMEDFQFLQEIKQQQATASLRERIANMRARNRELDPGELHDLIEAARTEFYQSRSRQPDAH
jgi:prevent-host-death family protein